MLDILPKQGYTITMIKESQKAKRIRKGEDEAGLLRVYRSIFAERAMISVADYEERLTAIFPEMRDDVTDQFMARGWIEFWKEAPPYQVRGLK